MSNFVDRSVVDGTSLQQAPMASTQLTLGTMILSVVWTLSARKWKHKEPKT